MKLEVVPLGRRLEDKFSFSYEDLGLAPSLSLSWGREQGSHLDFLEK